MLFSFLMNEEDQRSNAKSHHNEIADVSGRFIMILLTFF